MDTDPEELCSRHDEAGTETTKILLPTTAPFGGDGEIGQLRAERALTSCGGSRKFVYLGLGMLALLLCWVWWPQKAFSFAFHNGPPPSGVVSTTAAAASSSTKHTNILRPILEDLIGDNDTDVKTDVQFLLDYAIIGHSKCATSAQQKWLRQHPEILMYDHEVRSLKHSKPAEMVRLMYDLGGWEPNNKTDRPIKRGYKAPNDIRSPALIYLHQYWPRTKLIVGVRHPVTWFESYYNFNSRQGGHPMGPAENLIGDKLPDHARFHVHLSRLGKTPLADPRERELLGASDNDPPVRMENPVFLYDVSQPFDAREGRDEIYRKDLQEFLDLTAPLPPIKTRSKTSSRNYHYAIDICEEKYRELRAQLVEDGTTAAAWIAEYFLPLADVTVSSPQHFQETLNSWSTDPCDNKN